MRTELFGAHSTTEEVLEGLDLSGKRVLVTGVSAGLGAETARSLVAHGAEVIGAVRDLAKAREVAARLDLREEPGRFRLMHCDLASLERVRACAQELLASGQRLDLVIANAGVMGCPYSLTSDGFEMQFGVNHLGHFVLINRLLPRLASGARVVVLSSAGHRHSDVDLHDPGFAHTPYDPFASYGRSKTANSLFAVEFDRRHRDAGIRACAVHPGRILTELGRNLSAEQTRALSQIVEDSEGNRQTAQSSKSVEQGAATAIWAGFVARPDDIGGRYCEDCGIAPLAEDDRGGRSGVRPYAVDPARAGALWALSETMVGERFGTA